MKTITIHSLFSVFILSLFVSSVSALECKNEKFAVFLPYTGDRVTIIDLETQKSMVRHTKYKISDHEAVITNNRDFHLRILRPEGINETPSADAVITLQAFLTGHFFFQDIVDHELVCNLKMETP